MAAGVKCPVCGATNNKEDTIQVGRRYCCKEHAEEYRQTQAIAKVKDVKESSGYPELIAMICRVYGIKQPTGMMLRQIQTFHKDFKYTYDGMRATIIYCDKWSSAPFEFDVDRGIAFMPYVYDEARKFFEDIGAVQNQMDSINAQEVFEKQRIVSINQEDLDNTRRRFVKYMDIEAMEEEWLE